MKNIIYDMIAIGLCLGSCCGIAMAQEGCPEGSVAYQNQRTGETLCLQIDQDAPQQEAQSDVTQETIADKPDGIVSEDTPQDLNAELSEAHDNSAETFENTDDRPDENVETSDFQTAYDDTFLEPNLTEEEKTILKARAITQMAEDERMRTEQAMAEGGWELDMGFGIGLGEGFVYAARFAAGYVVPTSTNVHFSLRAESVLQFEVSSTLSMHATLTPTLNIIGHSCSFNIGLGAGIMLAYRKEFHSHAYSKDGQYYLDSYIVDNTRISFALKPILSFHYFFEEHAYWGLGLEIPMATPYENHELTVFFDIYMLVGYRF